MVPFGGGVTGLGSKDTEIVGSAGRMESRVIVTGELKPPAEITVTESTTEVFWSRVSAAGPESMKCEYPGGVIWTARKAFNRPQP
jgi:hypothetical protein